MFSMDAVNNQTDYLDLEVGFVLFAFKLVANLQSLIDDSVKGGLTQFWELFTMIPCAPKYLER